VPFRTYMDWVLHDPGHGAYGSGRLRIGPDGDFATAPSLGPDFAALLAVQVADWLEQLQRSAPAAHPLALVEAGPGEGSLAADLAGALNRDRPDLAACTELVLVEPNAGMEARQRRRLAGCPLPCRWSSFEALAQAPLRGVLLAHEVLDALAVERIVWDGALWRRQVVSLHEDASAGLSLRLEPGEPLEPEAAEGLHALGLLPPSPQRPPGWCTELHSGLDPWLCQAAAVLAAGPLLVIDYALEARRYYAPQRPAGTLMAYRGQAASGDPLVAPGEADLTAHLCIETLERAVHGRVPPGRGPARPGAGPAPPRPAARPRRSGGAAAPARGPAAAGGSPCPRRFPLAGLQPRWPAGGHPPFPAGARSPRWLNHPAWGLLCGDAFNVLVPYRGLL